MYCSNCGLENLQEATYCVHCGSFFPQDKQPKAEAPRAWKPSGMQAEHAVIPAFGSHHTGTVPQLDKHDDAKHLEIAEHGSGSNAEQEPFEKLEQAERAEDAPPTLLTAVRQWVGKLLR